CSVEGNVVGLDLYDNVGTVGLNLSSNRQCLSQSSSAPSRDPGLQLLEVPPIGPSVFPSTCVCQSTSVPSSDYSSGVSPAISKCLFFLHVLNSLIRISYCNWFGVYVFNR
ncbi:hypothetical protein Tco_0329646, partial [Tanacetum coccineum]